MPGVRRVLRGVRRGLSMPDPRRDRRRTDPEGERLMSWTPTGEQVEQAAEALDPIAFDLGRMVFPLFGQTPQEARAADQESARRRARAVLVAVGPHIAASAWSDGMEAGHGC